MHSRLPDSMMKNISAGMYKAYLEKIPDNANMMVLGESVSQFIKDIKPEDIPETARKKDFEQQKKSITGMIFELMMAEMLMAHKILPFYTQATMHNVPMSKFDFLCYHPIKPVVLSTKYSVAERWRQTAFEGDSIKRVYRNAKAYLITSKQGNLKKAKDKTDPIKKRKEEIKEGKILGIDQIFTADSKELHDCLIDLSREEFFESEKIDPIEKYGKIVS